MSNRKIWLDTDPGFDDWFTMLLLAANPALDWVGTSVVAGNAPLAATFDNAQRIQSHYGLSAPLYSGCDQALAGGNETAQHVLGASGMKTTGEPLPPVAATAAGSGPHAVQALIDAVRRHPGELSILAIAPLTNLATALRQAPDIAASIPEILLMGGSTDGGNQTAAAEFNIHADPEAASEVFNAGIPLRMFGLNLCRQITLTQAEVRQVRALASPRAQWFAGYLDAYQRIRSADGAVPMPLYDPVVAAYLSHPEHFEFRPAQVDIELQGRFTRGMTVCEFRPAHQRKPPVQVAMRIDAGQALPALMDRLIYCLG
ncbi:nucleoside hydrolase [Ideonella azotifigens]|uniref:Nucleoside hydrolase n=1 Tax=Ideonella azotifigens TaxID=513160 RepID=A0ABP3VP37_9BURK|nr:nucleoside hydrolase [Ideonella azotifigens]MCD2340546.1 nucleoside hydrolase [Ideonella azotifigens]